MEENDNVEIGLVPSRQTHIVISKYTDDYILTYLRCYDCFVYVDFYFRFAFFILLPLSHN